MNLIIPNKLFSIQILQVISYLNYQSIMKKTEFINFNQLHQMVNNVIQIVLKLFLLLIIF